MPATSQTANGAGAVSMSPGRAVLVLPLLLGIQPVTTDLAVGFFPHTASVCFAFVASTLVPRYGELRRA